MKGMRLAVAAAAMLFGLLLLRAQGQGTAVRTATVAALPPPRLLVPEADGKTRPLALSKADIRVAIAGPLAQTTMTLTFKNDLPRVLEGDLEFPLPEGATVTGYGLDVNGEMVDGVPVEKQKARVTFEKEERKGVDPGIVEQTVGNNYRTRIYPIPAQGTRTVKVQYVSDLLALGNDLVYRAPLRWGQPVPLASVRVEVLRNPGQPALRFGERERLLDFKPEGGGYVAERVFENAAFDSDLTVSLPGGATAGETVVESFTRATAPGPETYFVLTDAPVAVRKAAPMRQIARIGVAWDASLSREKADLRRERTVLRDLLRQLGTVDVDLVVFRNELEPMRTFHVANGDAAVLLTYLQGLQNDGGTNLSALSLPKNGDAYWLLFTDGLGNLGGEMPAAITTPVYAINSDPRANHALLRHLADTSGGAYFNLASVSDVDAVAGIRSQPFSSLSVTVNNGNVAGIYPEGRRPVQGHVLLTGKLLSDTATLTLNYGYGDAVTQSRSFTLRRADATTSTGLVGKFWAQRKADALSVFPEKNREWLLSLGRDFGIVTPNSSLIVLETLDQYVQYDITPPRSRAALYDAYLGRRHEAEQAEEREKESKIQSVLAQWKERTQWWEKEFTFPKKPLPSAGKPPVPAVEVQGALGVRATYGRTLGHATAGAASMPPPARDVPTDHWAMQPGAPSPAVTSRQVRTASEAGYSNQRSVGLVTRPSLSGAPAQVVGRRGAMTEGLALAESEQINGFGADIEGGEGAIAIKPWSPDTPYLKAMRAVPAARAYAVYLEQRLRFADSPSFYLDCAEYLLQKGQTALGVRVLTDVAELGLDDPALDRIVAHRLAQLGYRDLALGLFDKVRGLRPEEPQSWRDLALALADRGDTRSVIDARGAVVDYNRALSLLNKVIMNHWDRFEGIEVIALMEANRIIARGRARPAGSALAVPLDPRLVRNLPCDVRIVMTWDTDMTDMDLWVTEPDGEKCFYGHNRTVIGGRISNDFTQGYGPEEYVIHRAMPGAYRIQSNYYGSRQQRLTGGTTVQATVITDFGRPTEKRRHLTLRLTRENGTVDIGSIVWKAR